MEQQNHYIKQEIWARLTLYNFCEIITNSVVVEKKEGRKHTYQLNYTRAIRICCYFIAIKKEKAPSYKGKADVKRSMEAFRYKRELFRNPFY